MGGTYNPGHNVTGSRDSPRASRVAPGQDRCQKLIFGCGYLGRRVADRWLAGGEEVFVVTADSRACRAPLWHRACTPSVADSDADPRRSSVYPQPTPCCTRSATTAPRVYRFTNCTSRACKPCSTRLPPAVGKFIYISSTGVYGQNAGEWVDAKRPLAIPSARRATRAWPRSDRWLGRTRSPDSPSCCGWRALWPGAHPAQRRPAGRPAHQRASRRLSELDPRRGCRGSRAGR